VGAVYRDRHASQFPGVLDALTDRVSFVPVVVTHLLYLPAHHAMALSVGVPTMAA